MKARFYPEGQLSAGVDVTTKRFKKGLRKGLQTAVGGGKLDRRALCTGSVNRTHRQAQKGASQDPRAAIMARFSCS